MRERSLSRQLVRNKTENGYVNGIVCWISKFKWQRDGYVYHRTDDRRRRYILEWRPCVSKHSIDALRTSGPTIYLDRRARPLDRNCGKPGTEANKLYQCVIWISLKAYRLILILNRLINIYNYWSALIMLGAFSVSNKIICKRRDYEISAKVSVFKLTQTYSIRFLCLLY